MKYRDMHVCVLKIHPFPQRLCGLLRWQRPLVSNIYFFVHVFFVCYIKLNMQ